MDTAEKLHMPEQQGGGDQQKNVVLKPGDEEQGNKVYQCEGEKTIRPTAGEERHDVPEPFSHSYPQADEQQNGGDQQQTVPKFDDEEQELKLDRDEGITDTEITAKEHDNHRQFQPPLLSSCQGSKGVTLTRTILILGKVGMGKATIANKIAGTTVFPVCSPVSAMLREPGQREKGCFQTGVYTKWSNDSESDSATIELTFLLFDTRSSDKNQMIFKRTCEEELTVRGVNLIMFVLNEKTLTQEDTDLMDDILEHLQKEKVAESSVLVLTGCEQLGKRERNEYHKKLYESNLTKNIANFVNQELIVGFPDEKTKPLLMQQYKEAIEEDTQSLRKLVKSCYTAIPVHAMFKKKNWLRSLLF
jgi:hypothetical protein